MTFGYCLWKPSITFWNAFCSVAAQMPQNLTEPDTLEFPVVVELELAASSSAAGRNGHEHCDDPCEGRQPHGPVSCCPSPSR